MHISRHLMRNLLVEGATGVIPVEYVDGDVDAGGQVRYALYTETGVYTVQVFFDCGYLDEVQECLSPEGTITRWEDWESMGWDEEYQRGGGVVNFFQDAEHDIINDFLLELAGGSDYA